MKTNSPNQGRFLIAFLALAGIACLLWAISHYGGVAIHPYLLAGVRWAAIVALCGYSFVRHSLTPWIFAGMLVGAELGHELGTSAAKPSGPERYLSRLVKTIVAPLIFSTLVVGIAGHSNLKQVGRMGIKALLYFELVTTVALFIGLGAINLTQAGVGVPQPSSAASATVAAQPQKWTDIVLHIFPENIAKSVAEAQMLQIVVFSLIFGIALAQIGEEKRRPMLAFCESLSELMFKFTNIVMLFGAHWRGRRHGLHSGHHGFRSDGQSGQAAAHALRRFDCVPAGRAAADCLDCAAPYQALCQCRG